MICRRCGADVRPDKFCSNCGELLNAVQYCFSCGTVLPYGAHVCSHCGQRMPVSSQPTAAVPPVGQAAYTPPPAYGGNVNSGISGSASSRSGRVELKSRKNPREDDGTRRSGFQTFLCLILGIVGLGALGFTVYTLLAGQLFLIPNGGDYPLPAEPNSYGLIPNLENYYKTGENIVTTIQQIVGSGVEPTRLIASIMALLPAIFFLLSVPIAAVIVSITTVVAVLRFVVGAFQSKFFTLSSHVALAICSLLIVVLCAAFAGGSGYVADADNNISGLVICLILCAIALALCVIGNVLFAGKRFLKGGSIMKFLTNGGILVGAIVSTLSLPFIYFNIEGESGSLALKQVVLMVGSGNFEMPVFVFYATILLMTIISLFTLPFFVRTTAARLGKTFKFDGYEDKGFVRKSVTHLIGLLLLAVPAIVLVQGGFVSDVAVADSVYVFIAGGIITFISAILNRVFLNSDQL